MQRILNFKRPLVAIVVGFVSLSTLILLPIFNMHPSLLSNICSIDKVAAQDNQCLAQEVTISAQELHLLELQATNNAQAAQILKLKATNEALVAFSVVPTAMPIIITVPILITATPNDTSNVKIITATPYYGIISTQEKPGLENSNDLPPTSVGATVEIAEIFGAGSLSQEGITLLNNGANVNLKGWTINNLQGLLYEFNERILFSNGLVTVYSRTGNDTAIALFGNKTQPLFVKGDIVTLKDADGNIQSVYKVL